MKAFKIVFGLLVVVLAAVAIVVVLLANNLNDLVRDAIVDVGSDTLKTEVSLDKVDINLTESSGSLSGLTIGNPSTFTTPYVFQMSSVFLDLDLQSITDKTVTLKEITIDGAKIIAEQMGVNTNIQTILKGLEQGGGTSQPTGSKTESSQAKILIKIQKFNFINSSAELVSQQLGGQKLAMPDIHLKDIGGSKGLPPEQLAKAILKPLIKQINQGVQNKIKDLAEKEIKEKLKEKEDEFKEDLMNKLSDEEKGHVESLKSLFK